MQTINDRLGFLIEDHLKMTKTAFAKSLKVSQQYISKLIKTGNPSNILIDDICEKYNVNEEWLRTGRGEMFLKTPETLIEQLQQKYNMSDFEVRIFEKYFSLSEEKRKFFREFIYDIVAEEQANESAAEFKTRFIQYYQRLASAGTGEVIFNDLPDDRIEIPDIPEYRRVAYAISVNGRSMEPLYEDGDMLLVEPTCSIDIGEIGIFNVDGKAYVKKLGVRELISLNKEYENIPITSESICMGRVIDKYNIR
ncbi:MAG: helix-turn-helix domain-containing protein [Lachnospiraceae bacterium]|nr:helix-turn-helix domain-containing protein [Lachnospiraceae bacterium]